MTDGLCTRSGYEPPIPPALLLNPSADFLAADRSPKSEKLEPDVKLQKSITLTLLGLAPPPNRPLCAT